MFGFDLAIFVKQRLHVFVDVPEERRHGNERADQNPQEGKTLGPEGKVVDTDEDDGEGFKPEIEEGVDQGDVEIQKENDGFCKAEGKRANKRHLDDFFTSHAFGFELRLAFQIRVAGHFTVSICAAEDYVA